MSVNLFLLLLLFIDSSDKQNKSSSKSQSVIDSNYEKILKSLWIKKPDDWYTLTSAELYGGFPHFYSKGKNNYNISFETFVIPYPQLITPLFGYMKYPLGIQNGKFNPSIIGLLMNITGQMNFDKDCNLFIYVDQLFIGKPMLILSKSICYEVNINENRFVMQELTLNIVNTFIIKQTQYINRINNNYVLLFTLTYINEQDKIQLENIMRTLTFLH